MMDEEREAHKKNGLETNQNDFRKRENRQEIMERAIGVRTIKLRDTLRATEDKLTILGHPTTDATHVTWVRIIMVELRVVQRTGDN